MDVTILEGNKIRDGTNSSTIHNLDGVKPKFSHETILSITSIPNFLTGEDQFRIQRRSYSTWPDGINSLEDKKRDLEDIITPVLRKNIETYKQDSNTVWFLD